MAAGCQPADLDPDVPGPLTGSGKGQRSEEESYEDGVGRFPGLATHSCTPNPRDTRKLRRDVFVGFRHIRSGRCPQIHPDGLAAVDLLGVYVVQRSPVDPIDLQQGYHLRYEHGPAANLARGLLENPQVRLVDMRHFDGNLGVGGRVRLVLAK